MSEKNRQLVVHKHMLLSSRAEPSGYPRIHIVRQGAPRIGHPLDWNTVSYPVDVLGELHSRYESAKPHLHNYWTSNMVQTWVQEPARGLGPEQGSLWYFHSNYHDSFRNHYILIAKTVG